MSADPANSSPIRVAVFGAGAFGSNHARVYRELQDSGEGVSLVAIVDPAATAPAVVEAARKAGCPVFASFEDLLASDVRIDAASVAVPTVHHMATARRLMEAGVHVLIEKPLAVSLNEADELIKLARKHSCIAQVGHLERFNPGVRAAMALVTHPMFFEVHRLSIFTPRALDVDVVLDLMIHDLDIVLSMVDSPVKEIRAVGLPVLSDKVDIANVRVEFDSGCVANFTASRVSTEKVRKLRLFQPRQYVSIDYSRRDVFAINVDSEAVARLQSDLIASAGKTPAPASPLPFLANMPVAVTKPPIEEEEPLHAELRTFMDSIRAGKQASSSPNKAATGVSLEEGRRALALALDINSAIQQHARRLNLGPLGARR